MRRTLYFVMALALVLGFTQCKKEQPTPQTQGVRITLNVDGGNSNSRVIVNPTGHTNPDYATVTFEDGDVIYVGYNNAYVGTLTYSNSTFGGTVNISETVEGEHLHFYFLGGVGFTPTVDGNTATVVISDQTQKLPVISYSPSNEPYAGEGAYSATLQNKISIMKFNVDTPSTAPICITGMNNQVTLDFSKYAEIGTGLAGSDTDNGFTYGKDGDGVIKMAGQVGSGEKTYWAIVLPQAALTETGEAYSEDQSYFGTRPTLSAISSNQYLNSGITMDVNTHVWNGDLSALTTSDPEGFATAIDGMTITGTLGANVKVSIADGATVTLDNVTINGEMDFNYSWAGISCLGDATIILKDGTTNTVKGFFHNYPGIHIATDHTLTIQGTGSLDASSNGNGSGIGGGNGISCGHILIESGTITATGGGDAAGIGCGSGNDFLPTSCGNITISGGTVTAAANNHGDSGYGAGIGSGRQSSCGNITITDGASVTATKGNHALDCIGRGEDGTCGTITIGGTVYWDLKDGSTDEYEYKNGGDTYLTQSPLVYPTPTPVEQIVDLSTITSAYTAEDGDILTGTLGTGVQISIADDATITLRSANINGSDNLSGTFHGLYCLGDATIILENNDNVVKANCGSEYGRAGIFVPQHKTLTFEAGNSSGRVVATGSGEAAGIGGYSGAHCGAIVINSGKVNATAGSGVDDFYDGGSAGIGSSCGKRCDGITIHKGEIIAIGAAGAAGIGTGSMGICNNDNGGTLPAITINISSYSDGWVKATKGSGATYFIGGGTEAKCGIVTVGGKTYADGNRRGITSSTSLSDDFSIYENTLTYLPW